MTKQEIINDISKYIIENSEPNNKWYVGITKDIEERLFTFHKVKKEGGIWVYAPADTSEIAREIEQYFLARGADGGTGGGDDPYIVYAYKITNYTKER